MLHTCNRDLKLLRLLWKHLQRFKVFMLSKFGVVHVYMYIQCISFHSQKSVRAAVLEMSVYSSKVGVDETYLHMK